MAVLKNFNFSKAVATAIFGFLLSVFTTEILFAVPKGMEVIFGEILIVPILILLLYILDIFNEVMKVGGHLDGSERQLGWVFFVDMWIVEKK